MNLMADFYYNDRAVTGLQRQAGDLLVIYMEKAAELLDVEWLAGCLPDADDGERADLVQLLNDAVVEVTVAWDVVE